MLDKNYCLVFCCFKQFIISCPTGWTVFTNLNNHYSNVHQEVLLHTALSFLDTGVKNCAFYLLTRKIVFMHYFVICEEINLGLVELLSAEDLFSCCYEIIQHFGQEWRVIQIHQENEGILGRGLIIYAEFIKFILLSSQDVVRWLCELDIACIDHVIILQTILPATDKASKTFLFALVIIIHVCPATATPGNLVDRLLNWVHLIGNWWQHNTDWHLKSIIQTGIERQIRIWKLIRTWVVLRVLCVFLVLLLALCLLLSHPRLFRQKVRHIWFLLFSTSRINLHLPLLPSLL